MKIEIIKKVGKYRGAKIRQGTYGIFDHNGTLLEEYKTKSPMMASLDKRKNEQTTRGKNKA